MQVYAVVLKRRDKSNHITSLYATRERAERKAKEANDRLERLHLSIAETRYYVREMDVFS